jgi:alpha-1,3-glucosyltransferase
LQSWLFGKALSKFDPKAFALHTSRGYETPWSKLLLRWSVLCADVLGTLRSYNTPVRCKKEQM